jgi:hypothetical protein
VVFRWSALVRALAVLMLGAAAGYLLLRAGTEPAVMKYGRVFSALQFLLSVDRSAYATGSELALRFLAAHAAACFCAAAGFASAASLTATARSARAARRRAPPRPARASRPDAR